MKNINTANVSAQSLYNYAFTKVRYESTTAVEELLAGLLKGAVINPHHQCTAARGYGPAEIYTFFGGDIPDSDCGPSDNRDTAIPIAKLAHKSAKKAIFEDGLKIALGEKVDLQASRPGKYANTLTSKQVEQLTKLQSESGMFLNLLEEYFYSNSFIQWLHTFPQSGEKRLASSSTSYESSYLIHSKQFVYGFINPKFIADLNDILFNKLDIEERANAYNINLDFFRKYLPHWNKTVLRHVNVSEKCKVEKTTIEDCKIWFDYWKKPEECVEYYHSKITSEIHGTQNVIFSHEEITGESFISFNINDLEYLYCKNVELTELSETAPEAETHNSDELVSTLDSTAEV